MDHRLWTTEFVSTAKIEKSIKVHVYLKQMREKGIEENKVAKPAQESSLH